VLSSEFIPLAFNPFRKCYKCTLDNRLWRNNLLVFIFRSIKAAERRKGNKYSAKAEGQRM